MNLDSDVRFDRVCVMSVPQVGCPSITTSICPPAPATHAYMVSVTPQVSSMLDAGAVVAIGVSGGKDSVACALRIDAYLNTIGHTGSRVLIHADLGSVEWKDSLPVCERLSKQIGWELVVVKRRAGGMMERWETRWANNLARYQALECVKVILPWSTPSMRFCTSELKSAVIASELSRRFKGQHILSVTGVRHDESAARAKMPIAKVNAKLSKKNVVGLDWNAIIDWPTAAVFDYISEQSGPLHEAYTTYGSSRVSCSFCIMGSIGDMHASVSCSDNHAIYRRMVDLEVQSTFGLQGSRWLGDLSPALLDDGTRAALERAKQAQKVREAAEARIPKHLLFCKGWPDAVPSYEEAALLGEVRQVVSRVLGIPATFIQPDEIMARYAELIAERSLKQRLKVKTRKTTYEK